MRKLLRSRQGNVAMLTALGGAALIGAAGLAVDTGLVYLQARRVQGAADLAALAAASSLSQADARHTVTSNLALKAATAVEIGGYTPDPALRPTERFAASAAPNAARVTVSAQAPLFFGAALLGKSTTTVTRTATAAQGRLGAFTLGTRLASFNGGVANAVLTALTGSSVSLSAMDYRALADADVSVFQFLDALRADMSLTAVSYDRLLDTDVQASRALHALEAVLGDNGLGREAAAMARVAAATSPERQVKLGALLDLGPYAGQDKTSAPLDLSVSALDLMSMTLQGANGRRQLEMAIPNAGVPGVAQITAWLAVGEPQTGAAWLTIGPEGKAQVRTAQGRLYLTARVNAAVGALDVPLLVELASAEARLADVRCGGTPSQHMMRVDVRPSVAKATLGEINTGDLNRFTAPLNPRTATLLRLPALRITGSAVSNLGGEAWRPVVFRGEEISTHALKSVSSSQMLAGLASSTLRSADIRVTGQGGSLAPSQAAAPALDTVIDTMLAAAGLSVGEADVQAVGVKCTPAVLVT